MLKVSKLADYAVVVMVYIAKEFSRSLNARDIATHTQIALPTVSKILKLMAKYGLLLSQRGVKGGYSLALDATQISLAQILEAVDGRFGMTDCTVHQTACALEPVCSITSNWQLISKTIYSAHETLKLSDMVQPLSRAHLKFIRANQSHRGSSTLADEV